MNARIILVFALALPLSACDKGTEAAPPANGAAPSPKQPAAPPNPLAGWTDVDLGASGSAWKGWHVKGPPGATVKKAADGLEIAAKDGIGIAVSFTSLSLESTANLVREGVNYDQKPAILLQNKELLEWSSSYKDKSGPKTTFGFHMLVKTSGMTVGCRHVTGVPERAKLAPLEEACKTLSKR
ncbi:Hypothetical protein A7982_02079 [Minicystis rosea]|nr:Hypothetical protein A7982_02079 [Minicystis rosea]